MSGEMIGGLVLVCIGGVIFFIGFYKLTRQAKAEKKAEQIIETKEGEIKKDD